MDKSQTEVNNGLEKEILAMVAEDQRMYKSGKPDPEVVREHAKRMRKIIQRFGWTGKSLVGRKAADRAWLIVQHSDHDLKFQKWALRILREAVRKGEVEKRQLAYLTDRVLVNSGQPQIFGTQFYLDLDGSFKPRPIKDTKLLDQRRKKYGLEPFAGYLKTMKQQYKSSVTKTKRRNG